MADHTDKKPKQVAIRLPLIILVALLVMLAIAFWAFNRG